MIHVQQRHIQACRYGLKNMKAGGWNVPRMLQAGLLVHLVQLYLPRRDTQSQMQIGFSHASA
jgi:hypothetical protein